LNLTINIINVIVVILVTGMTVSGLSKNGSIITSGALSLYITYLTYSGMASYPET
jgi:hypothetical protein